METYSKIMEWVWLTLGIATTILITILGLNDGFTESVTWLYAASGLCFAMYFVRRFGRKRLQKMHEYKMEQMKKEKASKKKS
jgi:membrane associated rhomboid family serine protease